MRFFGMLPPTMFVLMPVFALLLKLFYVFKRRLYVEHLIVALHSHAFLFLNMLLGMLVDMLAAWARQHAGWLAMPLNWLYAALWLWRPIYLLIMQKHLSTGLADNPAEIFAHRLGATAGC